MRPVLDASTDPGAPAEDDRGGPTPAGRLASGAEDDGGAGDMGRDPGLGVPVAVGNAEDDPCCFFDFFRADSVPLASDRFGEPGRFNVAPAFFNGSECLFRPDGVLVPLVDAPDGKRLPSFSFPLVLSFFSPALDCSPSLLVSSSSSVVLYHIH